MDLFIFTLVVSDRNAKHTVLPTPSMVMQAVLYDINMQPFLARSMSDNHPCAHVTLNDEGGSPLCNTIHFQILSKNSATHSWRKKTKKQTQPI